MMQGIVLFFTEKRLEEAENRLAQLKVAVAEQETTTAQLRNQKEKLARENARMTDDPFE